MRNDPFNWPTNARFLISYEIMIYNIICVCSRYLIPKVFSSNDFNYQRARARNRKQKTFPTMFYSTVPMCGYRTSNERSFLWMTITCYYLLIILVKTVRVKAFAFKSFYLNCVDHILHFCGVGTLGPFVQMSNDCVYIYIVMLPKSVTTWIRRI